MKRKMFIGSSKEGLQVAKNIKSIIESQCDSWIDINLWNEGDVFTPNTATMDCLIQTAMKYDYAVLVATNDDVVIKRGVEQTTVRDNVIFEAGLFLGSLGKNRTFIVSDKAINLPTDYNGITVCFFAPSPDESPEKACATIISELNKTKKSYPLKHLPSAAIAMGYFDNYIIPFCENGKRNKLNIIIPQNFDSIDREVQTYKSSHATRCYNRFLHKRFRPMGYKYKACGNLFWDIPTTLQTLRKLLGIIIPPQEIGENIEPEEWLKVETYNFGHALEELVSKENLCKDRIQIEYI